MQIYTKTCIETGTCKQKKTQSKDFDLTQIKLPEDLKVIFLKKEKSAKVDSIIVTFKCNIKLAELDKLRLFQLIQSSDFLLFNFLFDQNKFDPFSLGDELQT